MPRETKAEKAARVEQDNRAAALLTEGQQVHDTLFGTITLGKNLGPSKDSQGWDLYEVHHSGNTGLWSSALVSRCWEPIEV